MTGSELINALDRYDRHIPFFIELVDSPPEFSLRTLEVGMVPPRRVGLDRHNRMKVEREFDIAET